MSKPDVEDDGEVGIATIGCEEGRVKVVEGGIEEESNMVTAVGVLAAGVVCNR